MLDAYESDLSWLRFGQSLEFTADGVPGQTFAGKIAFIDPQLSPETQTVRVRVNAENPDHLLKPGMLAKALVKANLAKGGRVISPELAGKWISPMHPEIVSDKPGKCTICGMALVKAEELGYTAITEGELPLVIPSSAVLHTGKRSVVYLDVSDEEGPIYEGRVIELGPRAGNEYVVNAGLKSGDRVVSEGAFKIDSSLQILAKPSMMTPGEDAWVIASADWKSVLPAYLEWQRALSEDEFENAQKAALTFAEIEAVANDATVGSAAAAAGTASDLDGQRPHFETVSNRLIPIIHLAPDLEAPLFEAHCPMAFKNKGASWIQKSETVANPYFGHFMHECGTINRTFGPEAEEKE
ncbi:MAG: Cu(I)/Ag(I) efflux system membrane fusion protein [Verrucomicrobiales bacterium]|jgi:Cu(I)/Ag(I) efflux system membrane fusion protein